MRLLPKPPGCKGCPFYGNGQGFVPDAMNPNATVVVWAQNPGEHEERGERVVARVGGRYQFAPHPHEPLIGPTGWTLQKDFLPLAGLTWDDIARCNTYRCRVDGKNSLPSVNTIIARDAALHCHTRHFQGLPPRTRVVVAMGEHALWMTTGEGREKGRTLSAWRGYALPYNPPPLPHRVWTGVWTPTAGDVVVLPMYHLAYLWRDWTAAHPTKRDWQKVGWILRGKWPEGMPPIRTDPPEVWPAVAAFDTEFHVDTGALLRYSLAYRTPEGEPVVYVVEAADAKRVPTPPRVTLILQNALADLPYLPSIVGDVPLAVEDTMLKHAVLWPGRGGGDDDEGGSKPGLSHGLDFLGSIYAATNRWKHLVHTNPTVYSGGDALGTWDVNVQLDKELARDPQSAWVYRHRKLPLLPILAAAHREGLRIDTQRAAAALAELDARMDDAEVRAQAEVGWPINLGSPSQVAHHLYVVERIHERAPQRRRWSA